MYNKNGAERVFLKLLVIFQAAGIIMAGMFLPSSFADENEAPGTEYRWVSHERPEFLSREEREENGYLLRVSVSDIENDVPWQSGVDAGLSEPVQADDEEPGLLLVSFDARHVDGSRNLRVQRPHGGSSHETVQLGNSWKSYSVEIEPAAGLTVYSMRFSLTERGRVAPGVCEIDDVKVLRIGEDGEPYGKNLLVNGSFEEGIEGWSARYRVREIVE